MKQLRFLYRCALAFACAFLAIGPVLAVDVQVLPNNTRAQSGFTHAARITWDDLNAADASVVQIQLLAIPTNTYIDRVAFYVEENFTNAAYVPTLGATNLVLNIGVGGTTNAFFPSNVLSYINFGVNTNLLIPYKATTSTNYLIATFSDGIQASAVDGYIKGKIRIYWRLIEPEKYRF